MQHPKQFFGRARRWTERARRRDYRDVQHGDLAAWFLGAHAENSALFERWVADIVADHLAFRAAHRSGDKHAISPADQASAGFNRSMQRLDMALRALLHRLEGAVPFFSRRYIAHMVGEQTMASQLGYIAAMLHNPNNVSSEISPVTSQLEAEVAGDLARMVGYDPTRSWGHLTAGGTIANFEALWISRAAFYFPVAAALAAQDLGVPISVDLPSGSSAPLASLDLFSLLNIRTSAALDLLDRIRPLQDGAVLRLALDKYSLATVGYQEYTRILARRFGHPLAPGVVLVPATAHYSWEKIVRALGIGAQQLVFVPVDERARMDPEALWNVIARCTRARVPIIACVSVAGTTEEGAFDRLDLILKVRSRAERELGVTFRLHSDACYGGYAASVLHTPDGERRSAAEIRASTQTKWPTDEWVKSLASLENVDSITVDPHKLGYAPYPAGALLLADGRARALVAADPPYLMPSDVQLGGAESVLGRFSFEGSRPGASAAGVWLSHRTIPLDARGYGCLIERTARAAQWLHAALSEASREPVEIITLPSPDLNIVCFVVTHPVAATLADLNRLNEGIYTRLSVSAEGGSPDFVISRTVLRAPAYSGVIEPLLQELGLTADMGSGDPLPALAVLRVVLMDPFLGDPEIGLEFISDFTESLLSAAAASADELSLARAASSDLAPAERP